MSLDVIRLIGAVNRQLSTRDKDGSRARVLLAIHTVAAPRPDVWDALTNPERIPRWFLPISGELRAGGRYQLEGNAGGDILTCRPARGFSLTWGMHGQASWVAVELSDRPEGTFVRLEHVAHVPDELWQQFGPGAVGIGWDQALLGLHQHFASSGSLTPESATAWLATEEGKSFVRLSGQAWCEASISAGDDPDLARAAADRTIALYSGA